MNPVFALWTEHEISEDDRDTSHLPPAASFLHELTVGQILVSCTERPSSFVLRGLYGSREQGEAQLYRMHEVGWDRWFTEWQGSRGPLF